MIAEMGLALALAWAGLAAQDPPLAPGEKLVLSVPAADGFSWSILGISPDGTAAAYQTTRDGKWSVVWNGGRLDELDKVEPFCAWKEQPAPVCKVRKTGKVYITAGMELSEGFDSASDPILSPSRKSVAFVARDRKVYVVVHNLKLEVLNVQEDTLTFSPGDELFYVASVKATNGDTRVASYLNQEWKELKGYIGGGPAGPVAFGLDGVIAYTLLGKGTVQTTTGTTGPTYDRVHSLRFSEDGQVLAYVAVFPAGGGKTKKQLAVGTTLGPKYDDIIGYPGLSRDGKTIAYIARKGTRWLVAQGTKFSDEYDLIRPRIGDVDQPVVSGDGRTVAFVAEKQGKSLLVVNNKVVDEQSYISAPVLNFNGSTVAYGYVSGRDVLWKRSAVSGR